MGVEGEERFRDEQGIIQDDYRIEFIKEHLKWIHRAIQEGSNVKGIIYGRLWTTGLGQMPIKTAMGLYQSISKKTEKGPSKERKLVQKVAEQHGF